jgi:hypothetical protein
VREADGWAELDIIVPAATATSKRLSIINSFLRTVALGG